MTNKKKSPNEIEKSTENDGEIIEICKKSPMTDKYVRNDWGEYLNYPKIPQYWKLRKSCGKIKLSRRKNSRKNVLENVKLWGGNV